MHVIGEVNQRLLTPDGEIVVTEYADRKMREGLDRKAAYARAAKRMAWPIIASTFTTVAAFAPLVFWPDIMGEFMGYLPRTVIPALLSFGTVRAPGAGGATPRLDAALLGLAGWVQRRARPSSRASSIRQPSGRSGSIRAKSIRPLPICLRASAISVST